MKFLHNTNRVEGFSDAVFAFAATLMVVSLDVNESFVLMDSKISSFVIFGVSFFVLVLLWKVHYNFFRRTDYVDNWIIAYNAILLFVILYFVFPLKSLINSWMGKEPISEEGLAFLFQLYGGGFLCIFLCFCLMYRRVAKNTKDTENQKIYRFYTQHHGIYVLVAFISIGLAMANVGIQIGAPGFSYGLLGPLCYGHARWYTEKHQINW